ncbi:MAG: DNA replication/repair protein RecF [Ruminococcus sp.]|nr:DNA replication/repair protein RecF [Ruminococcus sp.]
MVISQLKINGFKNLNDISIEPHNRLNILYGDNAQGKTNLVEAIWLCTGVRSFRSTKDKDMIDINGETMSIELKFLDCSREQTVSYRMARPNIKDKSCALNGVKVKAPSKLFGGLSCVVFTPEDLELSKGSPEKRRQFADLSAAQIKNSYRSVSEKYEQVLEQRNMLLKNISLGRSQRDELDVWDIQLAQMGAYISMLRYSYTRKLGAYASRLYSEISGGRERLELCYSSTVFDKLEGRTDYRNDLAPEYLEAIKKGREEDIRFGYTGRGVHRDDLCAYIDGLPARDFASQGQHRSIALVLKLAQANILLEESGEAPVFLLDDVLSELDPSRQEFVISKIDNMQVFITCCDGSIPENKSGKLYRISGGRIVR